MPPEVSSFTDELMIDQHKLSNDSRFHIFNVEDPSDVDIYCGMKNVSDSKDTFVLEMDDNDAYLRLSNHSAISSHSSSEYKLGIFCDDGTDETIFKLTVKVSSTTNDHPNVEIDSNITHIVIIGVCAFVCVLFVILFILALIRNWRSQHTAKENPESRINTDMSTIDKTVEPNPYVESEQTVDQQKANAYVEMSTASKH